MPTGGGDTGERTPLLQSENGLETPRDLLTASGRVSMGEPDGAPPSYDHVVKVTSNTPTVSPTAPPPYENVAKITKAKEPTVSCRVCHATINIETRMTQHVVKCQLCNEATPIRPPPPGKKYVRCPCNCLLICKASSNRIACPRPNCKRVITLGDSSAGTAVRAPAGTCRISCAHCEEIFMFNTLANSLAKCPHCRKVSSVGNSYARSRAILNLLIALVFIAVSVGISVGTAKIAAANPGLYVVWGIAYVIAAVFIGRFFYFVCMKVSRIEGPL